ncbi:A/G-specific DNA-adenine glycosylase [Saccharicrinis carchari]|uniref:Adenine DNA glycosylase n=1 Tax=Saccharicrinis carchari TaxID=1168039 RepID=A0A521CE79_SACCC|nr:A/G-specific adenine glycosylase [Saccharicrinis carchari]SMO57736.1 A/G-specific DNA-adenine glycosylase [Saccharicrinis carchari]
MAGFVIDLILWYKENRRDLPWRKTKDVYRIWVSEIILQQTRVNQGLAYYHKFLDQFPSVHHLAAASEDAVLKCWEGLGYYSRARNMHHTAKYVSHELNGVFPKTYEGLLKLKGIGAYTAAAISSICYNEYRTVVDGNVFRVLTRIYGIKTPIDSAAGKKKIEDLAHTLNHGHDKGTFNQAIMEFGALHCKPKLPLCTTCIFKDACWAYVNKQVDLLPVKGKKIKMKHRYMFYLFLEDRNNKTIIQRRNNKDIWEGLYQFPLIETETNISVNKLLALHEFNMLSGNQECKIISERRVKHQLTHQILHLTILNIQIDTIESVKALGYQIVPISNLDDYAFPKPLGAAIGE